MSTQFLDAAASLCRVSTVARLIKRDASFATRLMQKGEMEAVVIDGVTFATRESVERYLAARDAKQVTAA
jgi:hypothetical protein